MCEIPTPKVAIGAEKRAKFRSSNSTETDKLGLDNLNPTIKVFALAGILRLVAAPNEPRQELPAVEHVVFDRGKLALETMRGIVSAQPFLIG